MHACIERMRHSGQGAWRSPARVTYAHAGGAGRQDIPSGGTDEAAFANLGEMLALATYPKVAVKLSGAPSYSSHPYLRQVFDAFGPQRCFWGTDITRMPPEAPYPASLAGIHSGCPTGA